ncbi:histidine phosphatase family protein [Actinophytocola gossypii]|uniref:Histidine phosphatase family protein n=1 Tax=Actinophytocola gossypii TaxID=2812003 RepID=A0ABT2JJ42_9PSEU|nr:histidine phosphatase family protein [Actinophytocola gossypii]MCT2587806.1 histidine phosphatase family protein [Actinophytocola gossypii]
MAAIYLLRHGQASFGAADYDVLSEVGELQAKALGDELRRREVRVHAVWSGTLRRQLATAAACLPAAGIDLEVGQDPRWNEYDHLGLVPEGQGDPADLAGSARRFQAQLDEALSRWLAGDERVGTSGTWAEFSGGAFAAVNDALAALPRGGTALVFTSAGLISAICARLLHLPPEGFLAMNRTMANASITKLVSGRSGVSLLSYNEHAHFEGAGRELLTYR